MAKTFYPDIKIGASPSSIEAWLKRRKQFIKTYFEDQPFEGNVYTTFGTWLHKEIEEGRHPTDFDYEKKEELLWCDFGKGLKMRGYPDSFYKNKFVDYKTASKPTWTEKKLSSDIKMMATALLILETTPRSKYIEATIEEHYTRFKPIKGLGNKELEATGERTSVTVRYLAKDLRKFKREVVVPAMKEINQAYADFERGILEV